MPTGDDEAAGLESPDQAVNRLVEKMAAASALLTSPGTKDDTSTSAPPTTEAGLGLNQCVAAALKAVDREYQVKFIVHKLSISNLDYSAHYRALYPRLLYPMGAVLICPPGK